MWLITHKTFVEFLLCYSVYKYTKIWRQSNCITIESQIFKMSTKNIYYKHLDVKNNKLQRCFKYIFTSNMNCSQHNYLISTGLSAQQPTTTKASYIFTRDAPMYSSNMGSDGICHGDWHHQPHFLGLFKFLFFTKK